MRSTLSDRFFASFVRGEPSDCWPWLRAINRLGYGTIGRGPGRHDRAHRVSYELHVGPIPQGLHVLHSCDNRACVNPAHLRVGTHADNMRDMKERGRQNAARGERAGLAKLTAEQVLAIRARRAAGERQIALAREYGIDKTQVWNIVTRKVWKHV